MKYCHKCQEEFSDKVTKCLYCGGPVEVVLLPEDEKTAEAKPDYKLLIITALSIAVVILLMFSQSTNVMDKKEQPVKSQSLQSQSPSEQGKIATAVSMTPANTPVSESPISAANQTTAPTPATLAAYSLVNKALALCPNGKCPDPQKAIGYLDEAIKLKPDLPEAFNNRGNAYSDLKQYPRAIEDYDEAIRLKPAYAHPYYNRGLARSDLGQHEQALSDYNETIRLKPDETNAYINRGNTYFIQGDKTQGCDDAKKACELGNCKLLEEARSKKNCP